MKQGEVGRTSSDRQVNERYTSALELIAAFGEQFKALSDPDNLRLLGNLGSERFTNVDVRSLLGTHRQTSWARLSRLCRTGLVEKRGHSYVISSRTNELVIHLSTALANLVALKELSDEPELSRLLRVASEGIDLLYSKGRLEQDDYARVMAMIDEMTSKHGIPE